jgi:hypothetical protein
VQRVRELEPKAPERELQGVQWGEVQPVREPESKARVRELKKVREPAVREPAVREPAVQKPPERAVEAVPELPKVLLSGAQ